MLCNTETGRYFRKTITLDFKFALELTYQKLGGYKFHVHYDVEASSRCFPNGGVSLINLLGIADFRLKISPALTRIFMPDLSHTIALEWRCL